MLVVVAVLLVATFAGCSGNDSGGARPHATSPPVSEKPTPIEDSKPTENPKPSTKPADVNSANYWSENAFDLEEFMKDMGIPMVTQTENRRLFYYNRGTGERCCFGISDASVLYEWNISTDVMDPSGRVRADTEAILYYIILGNDKGEYANDLVKLFGFELPRRTVETIIKIVENGIVHDAKDPFAGVREALGYGEDNFHPLYYGKSLN